ncbi:hypothetical protein [Tenacibaculum soleae]|uniref:hypothetical protein n=1 Tax=Tenacibaculum soleae TaxID=447689 RepID=UPI0023000703|nr:hypothetical protein [Tenacibaculum soleae]
MSGITVETAQQFKILLRQAGFEIIDKQALKELVADANLKAAVTSRNKWISKRDAVKKHNITRYWLDMAEKDPLTKLKINYGTTATSPKKYNEQSILDELERQSI